jgi:hypothetical protein
MLPSGLAMIAGHSMQGSREPPLLKVPAGQVVHWLQWLPLPVGVGGLRAIRHWLEACKGHARRTGRGDVHV